MGPAMRAVQVGKAGAELEVIERPIPEPGQVRIKVDACGICHSDIMVKEGLWPRLTCPRIPGHEITGRVDAAGADVVAWRPGQSAAWDTWASSALATLERAAEAYQRMIGGQARFPVVLTPALEG
jgi:D-arabinose 1-dehydrogenase-like Zn-dependent alcohol dehydrogenase